MKNNVPWAYKIYSQNDIESLIQFVWCHKILKIFNFLIIIINTNKKNHLSNFYRYYYEILKKEKKMIIFKIQHIYKKNSRWLMYIKENDLQFNDFNLFYWQKEVSIFL